jgi:hypothetical protein
VRRLVPILAAAAALVPAAGCGSDEGKTPAACLVPSSRYLAALAPAPGPVRLEGGTRISECLPRNQAVGELDRVGASAVRTATLLNAAGRRQPRGPAPLRLGYLLGALSQGAAHTAGIHAELVRRLESAARFSTGGSLPPEFRRDYARGYAAGRKNG